MLCPALEAKSGYQAECRAFQFFGHISTGTIFSPSAEVTCGLKWKQVCLPLRNFFRSGLVLNVRGKKCASKLKLCVSNVVCSRWIAGIEAVVVENFDAALPLPVQQHVRGLEDSEGYEIYQSEAAFKVFVNGTCDSGQRSPILHLCWSFPNRPACRHDTF